VNAPQRKVWAGDHERAELRVAARNHICWSWREKCGPPGEGYDDGLPCTRIIAKGEQYLRSTIYPGHDSGYCDNRVKRTASGWVSVPPSPLSSPFCLPCAGRWTNLATALAALTEAAS